jgi:hypothetical protein
MANLHRGEIEAELGGARMRLCLTLGALAELEAAFGAGDLLALAERFERGRLSASDVICVLGAGLRGAGTDIADREVARLGCPDGAAGYVNIVMRLLAVTFGSGARETSATAPGGEDDSAHPPQPGRPFPGPM